MTRKHRLDPETERAVRDFAGRIAAQYDLAEIRVFGSRARGSHRPDSDADVAVLLRGNHQPIWPTKRAMSDVAFDVLLETGIRISPLPIWHDQWDNPSLFSNPALIEAIVREGVRL